MPVSYTIDLTRRRVLTKCWGVLTDDELLSHKERLAKDPDFCPTLGQLSDVRAVERLAVTTDGIKALVALDAAQADRVGGTRLAIVAAADEVFGMARMYSQRSERGAYRVAVFRSVDEAEAWLASDQSNKDESA